MIKYSFSEEYISILTFEFIARKVYPKDMNHWLFVVEFTYPVTSISYKLHPLFQIITWIDCFS